MNISADEGTTVTVNGETVKMSSNYYDEYEGNYVYKFEEEGSKNFIVEGKRGGKTKIVNVTAKYAIGVPILTITECPTSTSSKTITIRGTVIDNVNGVSVTINGESIDSRSNTGTLYWSKFYTLKEGENTFNITATSTAGKTSTETRTVTLEIGALEITFTNVFRAVNSYGKSKTISKTIKYVGEIKAPVLKVDDIISSTTESKITITGTVNDSLDSKVVVYVNDKKITSGNGNWSANVSLDEGNNDIIVVATNAYGKSTTVVKKITYTAPVSDEQSIE